MLDVRSYQRDEQHGDYSRGRLLEMNAWQRRATAPGAPAGVFSGRPRVIEVGSGGLIRPGRPVQPECGAAPRVWPL